MHYFFFQSQFVGQFFFMFKNKLTDDIKKLKKKINQQIKNIKTKLTTRSTY